MTEVAVLDEVVDLTDEDLDEVKDRVRRHLGEPASKSARRRQAQIARKVALDEARRRATMSADTRALYNRERSRRERAARNADRSRKLPQNTKKKLNRKRDVDRERFRAGVEARKGRTRRRRAFRS